MNPNSNRVAKRFRIMTKGRMIPDGKGGEKPIWLEIGQITVFTDQQALPEGTSFSVELNHMPGKQLSAFPVEKKNNANQSVQGQAQAW